MGSAVLRALTICALLLKTTSSSFVSNDSLTTRQTLRPRIAVCIAGAVRSLTEREVYSSIYKFYEDADIFYHLYVGVELSIRGQRKSLNSRDVTNALVNATGVRLQYNENDYTCGQQTTGKFYKDEQCARMVLRFAAMNNITYDAFILTRPDYMPYVESNTSVFKLLSFFEGQKTFYHNFGNEIVLLSAPDGVKLTAKMTQAQCCNNKERSPKGCFFKVLKEPRPNFIAARHFSGLGKCKRCPPNNELGVIVRTSEFVVESQNKTLFQLHGKTKKGVTTNKDPGMSPPMLEWGLLGLEEQESIISHFIHAAI